MAVGGTQLKDYDEIISQENYGEQNDELLALQSIYDGSCARSVEILNTSTEEDGGIRTLHITIPIPPSDQELKVKVKRSEGDLRDDTLEGATAANNLSEEKDGEYNEGSIQLKYLPPLTLQAVLPPTYPSQHAPDFTLSCVWLTANQLSALCGQLDRLWEESQNLPVLFTWIDWLENNVFSYLDIGTTVTVSAGETSEVDSRVQTNHDIREALDIIKHYNSSEENEEFRRSNHECPVCCEELPGGQFYKLDGCGHHFCVDCLTDYCLHHVSIGSVEKLRCPECDSGLPPHIIGSVLPADQFDRWERLLLQRTLESMTDMDWCPRCNNPVIREMEEELNLGHCTTCYFSFCTACRNPWHQGEPCVTLEEQLEAVEETLDINETSSLDGHSSDEQSSDPQLTHFEERKRKLEEEIRSKMLLQKQMKMCPNCTVLIEKMEGCNMMRCRCGTRFCYLCGEEVENYNHFLADSRCSHLDLRDYTHMTDNIQPENIDSIETTLFRNPAPPPPPQPPQPPTPPKGPRVRFVRVRTGETSKCPNCRVINVKTDRNNHIKCRCCSINYCYVCGEQIKGVVTAHFTPGKCPNHS